MRKVALVTLLAACLGGSLAVAGTAGQRLAGTPAPAAFRLADGSAGCAFDGTRLACRSHSTPSAVVLESDGRSEADDVEVEWTAATPVLRTAERWLHAGYTCRIVDGDIVCESGPGSISVGAAGFGGASSRQTTLP